MDQSQTERVGLGITRLNAERLIQALWAVYNNSTLYGSHHPLAEQALIAFERKILEELHGLTPITFHMADDAMHCEEWRLSKEGFATRLTTRFLDMKIQSITFHRGLTRTEIQHLFELVCDPVCNTVELFQRQLDSGGSHHIEPNFVMYQRVTKNDTVVKRDVGDFLNTLAANVDRPSKGFPAAGILTKPDESGDLSLVERIRLLRDAVVSANTFSSSSEFVDSLSATRAELSSLMEQRLLSKADRVEASQEFNSAMFDVVAKIVREEYSRGKVTVRRLAQIIRKLLPGTDELRAFLPRLRDVLLEEGMSLSEYADVVTELAVEFEQDGVLGLLSDSAKKVGVSLTDLLESLHNDPDSAVRLILLVAEIGGNLDPVRSQRVDLLDRFIERVVPLSSATSAPVQPLIGGARNAMLDAVENELLKVFAEGRSEYPLTGEKVSSQALEANVQKTVDATLEEVLKEFHPLIKQDIARDVAVIVASFVDALIKDLDSVELSDFSDALWRLEESVLSRLDEHGADLAFMGRVQNTLKVQIEKVLEDFFDSDVVARKMGSALESVDQRFRSAAQSELLSLARAVTDARSKQRGVPKARVSVPSGIMRATEARKRLGEEIARHKRYATPVTCISISFVGAVRNGVVTEQTDEELSEQVKRVCSCLSDILRDLDMIGTFGAVGGYFHLFAILGMTGAEGAAVVKNRVSERLREMEVEVDDERFRPAVAVSLIEYDPKNGGDAARFIRKIKAQHRRIVKKTMTLTAPETPVEQSV